MRPATRHAAAAAAAAAAVTATAVVGSLGTDPGSHWYRRLDKPSWQPPGWAFGPAWTTLYLLMAVAAARALNRADGDSRRRFAVSFGANLVLNAGWNWIFFKARKPSLALAELGALNASNLGLVRRAGRIDRTAGWLLAPYAAWTAFATALNASIVRRNPGQ